MDIGYARTSTSNQHIENQVQVILSRDVEQRCIFIDEGVSGTTAPKKRPGFHQMMKFIDAHPGEIDRLYVFEVSRLGRKFLETLQLIEELETEKGIMVISLSPAESWFQIEDRGLRNGVILPILSWVAERELENLRERINAGLDRARKQGKKLGRPPKKIDWGYVQELRDKRLSWAAIARVLEIPESSFYRQKAKWLEGQREKRVNEIAENVTNDGKN